MMLPQRKSVTDNAHQVVAAHEVPFARMREAFARVAGGGFVHRQYLIAGFAVDVRIAGEQLADQVTRAFAHLETVETDRPALVIELWDEGAAGIGSHRDWGRHATETLILMKASKDGRFVCEYRPQGLAILDRTAHRIVACTSGAGHRHLDERARPFHRLLSTWLNDRGIQFVHAGLVSVEGRGILFGGHGGAGKSTSSVACLRAGHEYLGDDFIGLERREDGSFRGYGLYASCLFDLEHMTRFPDLLPHALAPYHAEEDKAVFYLNELFPHTVRHKTQIRGIALPRVVDQEESFIERASKGETLLALAPTSVMLLPAPTSQAFHTLALLVDRLPSYRLCLGRDVNRIPDAVRRLATGLAL